MLRALLLLNGCQTYDVRTWAKFEELDLPSEALLQEGETLWEKIGVNERNRLTMRRNLDSGWLDREIESCGRMGIRIVTCRDAIYPANLLELHDAPLLLYVRGERFTLPREAIGVVGTRRCSSYANQVAHQIGMQAAGLGVGVVSGGAKGVDGAAHMGCLEGDGITVAVLGTGVDMVYPAEHVKLFERIQEHGALFSEYPLGVGGEGWRFPRRNRIIAGLAARTVVVEAPIKSGAMITARICAEAGRDVWAVPGRINDERCRGSNGLIFDGAYPLIDLETFFGTIEPRSAQKNLFEDETPGERERLLNDTERILVALLTNHGDRTIDNLATEAKMSAAEVFKTMSLLSIRGLVRSSGPGRYRLND